MRWKGICNVLCWIKRFKSLEVIAVTVRIKPYLLVGTIGHIGHGKTTLASAITRYLSLHGTTNYVPYSEIKRMSRIDARGLVTIMQIEYETRGRRYGHIDYQENTDYIVGMISGAAQMDGAILVIDATESVMPQTHEHVFLARQINVPYIIVFINKIDMVDDPELVELVEMEVRDLLNEYGFPGDEVPVIKGSALKAIEECGDNPNCKWYKPIQELLDALDNYIPAPVRELDKPFLMAIEDVVSIAGRGTAVTGHVERDRLALGEEVEVVGFRDKPIRTVVTSIQMFRKILDEAFPNYNVGIFLRGIEKDDVERGMVVAKPGNISPHKKFRAQVYVLKKEEGGRNTPFFNGYRPGFYFRTREFTGTIKLPDTHEMVIPGEHVTLEIELDYPVAIERGLRFSVREDGKTIGVGIVTEVIE